MKKYAAILFIPILIPFYSFAQTIAGDTCITSGGGGGGNVVIFANYDGGVLNIDVDQNIPNLKIGICTYEPVTINLTGTYVNNVTEVRYAGYVTTSNNHCPNSPGTTTINGVPGGAATSVNFLPPATLSNPNGYSMIVCGYSCDNNSNQGGCNTADQIQDYFVTTMGGSLYSYFTQYGCWSVSNYAISGGSNCPLSGTPDTTSAMFFASASAICIGDTVNFTDISPGAVSWNWTAPGSSVVSSTLQHLNNVTWSTSGTYTVTLSVNDGTGTCSASQLITVYPAPTVPTINYSGGLLTATPGSASYYQWYFNGTPISGANASTYSPAQNGNYTVSYVDANGCNSSTSAATSVSDIGAGIEDYVVAMQIYPNPGTGIFQLHVPAMAGTEVNVEVVDVLGAVVYHKTAVLSGSYLLDISGHSNGIYQLRISNGKQTALGKLILQSK